MFKFKKQSKYKVKIGEMYNVHGSAYEITGIKGNEEAIVYGVSINGGREEALFYISAMDSEKYKKYIKRIL
jgi:hypothetical protein